MNKLVVTKHNELVESSYRLTLTEARIVFYGLSLVNPTAKDFNYQFKIDIKDFAKMFGLESDKGLYDRLKTAAMDKFWLREFTFPTTHGRKLRASWLSGIEYGDKEGYLKIFINPQLQPFLHQLHNNFTSYHLENISRFNSIYSVRFYEFSLMQLNKSPKSVATFKIDINEIKEMLELENMYKRFCDFKLRVLETAKKEINEHSDIKLNYTIIKQGRTPHTIKFTVTKKPQERKETQLEMLNNEQPKIPIETIEQAKKMLIKAKVRLDIYQIEQEFYSFAKQKGQPQKPSAAFIGFVKKKISNQELTDLMSR